ncbi:MAG TPA: hypothetical protein VKH19_06120 [Gemmatimonadaceae bacterium]|nr:hypothetical protein [Gemmatimonadaceae bacterium]
MKYNQNISTCETNGARRSATAFPPYCSRWIVPTSRRAVSPLNVHCIWIVPFSHALTALSLMYG